MPSPKVSVIVPIYNMEKYLLQCLESLKAQTLKEIEFIVINDGSTDRSGEILRDSVKDDSRFKIIEQDNKGYAEVRNVGLKHVTGEYVGFLDSDDWCTPELFETLYTIAKTENADLAECSYFYYNDRTGVAMPRDLSWIGFLLNKTGGIFRGGAEAVILDDAVMWNKIYRAEMVRSVPLYFHNELKMAEDVPFFWESVLSAGKIAFTPEPLTYYRIQRKGQQTSIADERLFSFFELFNILQKFIKEKEIVGLDDYVLHLQLSRHCYGYEKASVSVRPEYFQKIRHSFLQQGMTSKSRIARGCISAGGLTHKLRYALLSILHPVSLYAILNNNQMLFERVIRFRIFVQNLPTALKIS